MFGWLRAQGRLRRLEDELTKLQRAFDDRELDWIDMRARCKRLLDRTEKAQRRIDSAGENSEDNVPQELSSRDGGGTDISHGRVLSAHQLEIQQKVLRRRAGLS